MIDYPGEEVEF